nr:hypothetical protein [uncultured Celeribacter sp.]
MNKRFFRDQLLRLGMVALYLVELWFFFIVPVAKMSGDNGQVWFYIMLAWWSLTRVPMAVLGSKIEDDLGLRRFLLWLVPKAWSGLRPKQIWRAYRVARFHRSAQMKRRNLATK